MLIGEKIKSPGDNQTWQLVLQLREIVSLICAPAISAGQNAYLRVLIDEYLHFRKQAFPGQPLKPKHHNVSHYPGLIMPFGPLIRLWTLRFESKHTFFNQCARKLHNFKNVCSTLVERHQLLQAYLNAGNLFPPAVGVEKAAEFFPTDYNHSIRNLASSFDFGPDNTLIAHEATVKGTKYKNNVLVVINENSEGLVMGKIIVVLGSAVYFVIKKCKALFLHDTGVYSLTPIQECYCCVKHDDLADYYPLPEYALFDMPIVVPHHSFLSTDSNGDLGGRAEGGPP